MFFILSKLLYYLILPFSWIVILLVCSAIFKRKRLSRRCFRAGIILLILFSNSWLSNQALSTLEVSPTHSIPDTEMAIVLTGIVENGIYINGQTQLSEGAGRLTEAVKLLKQGVVQRVLISGGAADIHNPGQSEGLELYNLAQSLGVDSSQLIHENQSRNTYENAKYSKVLLGGTSTPPLLITSAFHMRRAHKCFKKQGVNVIPYPVDYRARPQFQWDDLVPNVDALEDWNIILKEMTGMAVYYLMGYI
jgi:uncharacterized SAM-binding protein YcdF (DUF218 family)